MIICQTSLTGWNLIFFMNKESWETKKVHPGRATGCHFVLGHLCCRAKQALIFLICLVSVESRPLFSQTLICRLPGRTLACLKLFLPWWLVQLGISDFALELNCLLSASVITEALLPAAFLFLSSPFEPGQLCLASHQDLEITRSKKQWNPAYCSSEGTISGCRLNSGKWQRSQNCDS